MVKMSKEKILHNSKPALLNFGCSNSVCVSLLLFFNHVLFITILIPKTTLDPAEATNCISIKIRNSSNGRIVLQPLVQYPTLGFFSVWFYEKHIKKLVVKLENSF